ncbi:MAG: ErfK/YbiS/YcfS/YnhG [uncultured Solirubrobacteraceae bacterium]|uniref:ErfK/YbiS/YcfS/YnhG n=1 Tax=uncultured Solirubrobacteraceae bacterium TaxID=1162706 RepID=A0A6J4RQR8_9ACTN|nr:MAG: ErfK/YbiS/YcfS/YnhG [uncultured Solirubrobacteraceae bacterium]
MRRCVRVAVACALAGACAAPPASGATSAADSRAVRPIGANGTLGDERLSDERRVTRYAGAVARAAVRHKPSTRSARVGRLRYLTEDGPFEVYPVLESQVDAAGRTWLRIRLPMRPSGRTGWVQRNDLGTLHAVRTMLRVNRGTLRATLYRDGRRIWSSPIGVGTAATPTPAGNFWIRSRLRGLGSPVYGPYAFGTAAYSVLSDWPGGGVIGVHGTDQPELIPGRPSHGCIRVPNAAITRLWQLMPIGTPVQIV